MAHVCPWWFAYTFDHRLRRFVHNPYTIVGPHVEPGMTVMDLGCGMGYFSIPMARMTGGEGRVLAVDIQPKILDVLMRRARKAGVSERIEPVLCDPERLCVEHRADFALAFFAVHETPDPARFLSEVGEAMKPGAKFLFVEPKLHVTRRQFEQMLDHALLAGFTPIDKPRIAISHAALLEARNY
jgi:ubiquinone/menaquinone biosynthesis C-methylase UbiE